MMTNTKERLMPLNLQGSDFYTMLTKQVGGDMEIRHFLMFVFASMGKITPSKANVSLIGDTVTSLMEEGFLNEQEMAVYGAFYSALGAVMEKQAKAFVMESSLAIDTSLYGAEVKYVSKSKKHYPSKDIALLEIQKKELEGKIKALKKASDLLEKKEATTGTYSFDGKDYEIKQPLRLDGSSHISVKLPSI